MEEYIKREEVIQHFKQHPRYAIYKEDIIRYFTSIPAADVKPVRHGHWVKDEKHGLEKCSICNEIRHFDIYDNPDQVIYLPCNYCPNCGAKMNEEVE